jgi:hypothetical protein
MLGPTIGLILTWQTGPHAKKKLREADRAEVVGRPFLLSRQRSTYQAKAKKKARPVVANNFGPSELSNGANTAQITVSLGLPLDGETKTGDDVQDPAATLGGSEPASVSIHVNNLKQQQAQTAKTSAVVTLPPVQENVSVRSCIGFSGFPLCHCQCRLPMCALHGELAKRIVADSHTHDPAALSAAVSPPPTALA